MLACKLFLKLCFRFQKTKESIDTGKRKMSKVVVDSIRQYILNTDKSICKDFSNILRVVLCERVVKDALDGLRKGPSESRLIC